MGEVTAVREVQTEDRVAGLDQRHHRRGVGQRAGVGLDVGGLRPEQCLDPVDGQLLDHVDVFATPVVAAAGVALGVLVGEDRALRLHDCEGCEVLAGDHLERAALAGQLGVERGRDLGIEERQRGIEYRVGARQQVSHGHGPSVRRECIRECNSVAYLSTSGLPHRFSINLLTHRHDPLTVPFNAMMLRW